MQTANLRKNNIDKRNLVFEHLKNMKKRYKKRKKETKTMTRCRHRLMKTELLNVKEEKKRLDGQEEKNR